MAKKEKVPVRYKKVIVHHNDSHSTDTGVRFIAGNSVHKVRFEKEMELPEVAINALLGAIPIETRQEPKSRVFIKTPKPKYRVEEIGDWYTKESKKPEEKPEQVLEEAMA